MILPSRLRQPAPSRSRYDQLSETLKPVAAQLSTIAIAVLGFIVLFASAGELGKRASKAAPHRGDVDHVTASETPAASIPR